MVSVKRIEKFLFAEEIDHKSEEQKGENRIAFSMKNGNYYWGKEQKDDDDKEEGKEKTRERSNTASSDSSEGEHSNVGLQNALRDEIDNGKSVSELDTDESKIHVLKDINLEVEKGKLVMVIGDIGSGKSSLLLALLN